MSPMGGVPCLLSVSRLATDTAVLILRQIGDNPMASWGYTNETDGMDGQQPRYTNVLRNYVREWGHYEKQSSMWSNNKACLAHVEGNVVFNGPRAGIK